MNIKEYTHTRNIPTQKRVKELCLEVLGLVPIDDLTDEQVVKLDKALVDAGEALKSLLPPSDDGKLSSLPENSQPELMSQQTTRIANIVGDKVLLKNLAFYLTLIKTKLTEAEEKAYQIAFQSEQVAYNDLANRQKLIFGQSLERINKAIDNVSSWNEVRAIVPSKEDSELCDLYESVLELMDSLGL